MSYRLSLLTVGLICASLAVPLRAPAGAEMTPSQRAAIEGVIHDYLMRNPDVLIEALRRAEDRLNHEADLKASRVLSERRSEIFGDPATPVGGNPQGDVTIVEFFDYQCPYCKQVLPSLQTLLKEDHNLRFIYKEMPVLGAPSITAAHAALAAQRQGKYEAFHTAMMGTK
ncbi:MAG: thioredoxin domain-containing protein, partial [Alphaproteobacteria bacterium]|nr:thioredoxin domain-containing protein [Alphaproteobacteria bacterium]